MRHLYHKRFTPEHLLGFDTVQDYLELACWYCEGGVNFICTQDDKASYKSMYSELNQLEKEGYLLVEWEPYALEDEPDGVLLKQITLTAAGHKLLEELNERTKTGRLKKRISELAWVIVTSIATTLVVLWLRQKM